MIKKRRYPLLFLLLCILLIAVNVPVALGAELSENEVLLRETFDTPLSPESVEGQNISAKSWYNKYINVFVIRSAKYLMCVRNF
jgi:hypothetical protein